MDLNIPALTRWMCPRRHRAVRSKSRWRKTLERHYRPHRIVKADRKNPLMTVEFHPRSEEERALIEERQLRVMMMLGTAGVIPSLLAPGRREGAP